MFSQKEKARLLRDIPSTEPTAYTAEYYERCQGLDDVSRMQYLDINRWMVGDILLKADRMSMAHSLELRVPFLDREVFQVASRHPDQTPHRGRHHQIRHAPGRREAHAQGLGQQAPSWAFRCPSASGCARKSITTGSRRPLPPPTPRGFSIPRSLSGLLDQHAAGKKDNSRKIWTVYMFLVWYGVYFSEQA